MSIDSDEALHEFVAARYPCLRRSAFLMCGDWSLADELTQIALAHLVADTQRRPVDDPDAYVYSHVMSALQHRPARRQHIFAAGPAADGGPAPDGDEAQDGDDGPDGDDQIRTVLMLDALHRLAPRCRAVMVLRHWSGFTLDETADLLGLPDERVEAYERAGLAALENLLTSADELGAR